jgi:hypothetical protein
LEKNGVADGWRFRIQELKADQAEDPGADRRSVVEEWKMHLTGSGCILE